MTEPFGEAVLRLLEDADRRVRDEGWALGVSVDADSGLGTAVADALEVRKHVEYIPVTCCVMTDTTGVNHCTHAPPPPVPWRRRLRWRIAAKWSALRMRLGSWIAGVDLEGEDES